MAMKKKFIDVEIPSIGETIGVLGTLETVAKKTIKLDLSRKLKGKGLEIVYLVLNQDGKLIAYPKNMNLMRSYIQRMMRKRISYVEDSFEVSCKDITATIKPFLITRKKVSRAIKNSLRKATKEFLTEYTKDKNYLTLAQKILEGDTQKEIYPKLKKIYPLSVCEIRIFETKNIEKADFTKEKEKEVEVKAVQEEIEEETQAEEIERKEKEKKNKEKALEKTE